MPREFGRNRRVAQLIKEELAILIQEKFPLSQFGLITLTNVDVSSDLKKSTIYFTSIYYLVFRLPIIYYPLYYIYSLFH